MILKSCKDEITSNTDKKRIYTLKKQVEGNHREQEKALLETRDKSLKILGNAFQDKKVLKDQNRWGLKNSKILNVTNLFIFHVMLAVK